MITLYTTPIQGTELVEYIVMDDGESLAEGTVKYTGHWAGLIKLIAERVEEDD